MPSCTQICAAVISPGGGRQPGGSAQFVARKDRFQRHCRLCALMRRDVRVQRGNDFPAAFLSVKSETTLISSATTRIRAFKPLAARKSASSAVLQRRFLRLKNHRLGLFRRHDEMPVLFHFALGGFPPFFPVVADDVRHEHVLDLVRRRLAAVSCSKSV